MPKKVPNEILSLKCFILHLPPGGFQPYSAWAFQTPFCMAEEKLPPYIFVSYHTWYCYETWHT